MKKFVEHRELLFSTLSEITSLIIAGNDKRIIFQKLLDCSLKVLDAERVHLFEIDQGRILKYTKSRASLSDTGVQVQTIEDSAVVRDWMLKEGGEWKGADRGRELAFDLPTLGDHCLEAEETNRVIISAPLVAKKSMFGLLIAIHADDGSLYSAEDVQLVTILANHAAIAVENAVMYQKLEMEAITDGLTGVYNYRYLISSLETEIKRARRFRQSFSFVMLDVDNLKAYNDRLGHLSGSAALVEIAAIIREACREIDLVSKYGGDEFGILLPQTRLSGAEQVTKRVIDSVRKHGFGGGRPGVLTCSAGISTFPRDGQTVRDIISAADKALYQAKRSGKNTVLTTEDLIEELV